VSSVFCSVNLPNNKEIGEFLDLKYEQYNNPSFIDSDPISIPHRYSRKEDIEISGFLTATISWGNRTSIVNDARKLMVLMDGAPYDFVVNSMPSDLRQLTSFYHRTFNGEDCLFFIESLKKIYTSHEGLENVFAVHPGESLKESIIRFREIFLHPPHFPRCDKHVSDPAKGSAAKRILMFLRWMVRDDNRGVDFGLWKTIKPSALLCPLDIHSGNVARKLGLLQRNTNDWKAVEELMAGLREFDPLDPVKYDFALFGLGVFENF